MQLSSSTTPQGAESFCAEIPASFTSIEQARNSFEYHATSCIHLFAAGGLDPTPEQLVAPRQYLDILDRWCLALQTFLHNAGDSLSTTGQQAARVMKLNCMFLAASIGVSTQINRLNEMLWDNHLADFQQMMALARKITKHAGLDLPRVTGNLHRFQMDMNIIAPLYGVASRCRDPTLRREAVALLRTSQLHQGLWDSAITSRVCGKLVEIEEEGLERISCCEDVPEWARISGVNVKFDTEGRLGTTIAYRRRPGPFATEIRDFREMVDILPGDLLASTENSWPLLEPNLNALIIQPWTDCASNFFRPGQGAELIWNCDNRIWSIPCSISISATLSRPYPTPDQVQAKAPPGRQMSPNGKLQARRNGSPSKTG